MAYLGTKPQSGFISQEANQYFTGLTQNYIDLNQSISSLSSVIILVNGVVQENSTMSLTSSTRITLGDTLVSADKVTCIYVAKISSTQAPAIGSVTSDMLSGSIANSKLANSSITLNGSAVSLGGSATVGGDNTPIFRAGLGTSPTLSTGADTFITFTNEIIDTDNAYDTSNGRFTVPTGEDGKYFIHAQLKMNTSDNFNMFDVNIFKNNTAIAEARHYHDDNGNVTVSLIVDASAGDYFRARGMQNSGSNQSLYTHERFSYFEGFKLL